MGVPDGSGERLVTLMPGGLIKIIEDAWRKMHTCGAYLWSLNVSDNPFYMKRWRTCLRVGLCNGFFWGCRNRKNPKLLLRCGDGHEDVERTVRYFDMDEKVLRYREFCAKTRCKTNGGGLQASMTRAKRQEAESKAISSLVDEFPHLLVSVPGAVLGVKFHPTLKWESVVSCMTMRDAAAKGQLAHLEGGRWISKKSSGWILRCSQDGVCFSVAGTDKILGCDLGAFHDALRRKALCVWLPRMSCDALGVSYRDLPREVEAFLKGHVPRETTEDPEATSCLRRPVDTPQKVRSAGKRVRDVTSAPQECARRRRFKTKVHGFMPFDGKLACSPDVIVL